jgi:putative ABC transport system substrate-binding protein
LNKNRNELEKNLDKLAKTTGSEMIVVEDQITVDGRVRLAEVAAKKFLPAIYGLSQYADAGGPLSYGIHLEDLFRRTAIYLDKILKGTKPADIPLSSRSSSSSSSI